MQKQTLETKLLKRIERKRSDVFLLADFKDLADYDQVGRGLRKLIQKGRLIKIGMGLYTRAGASPFDGRPAPIKGLRSLTVEALGRLGVETKPTQLERAYNAGRTTQVPAGRVVAVTKRVRRKIGFDGNYIRFERA
jgi:hypothetical protein